MIVYLLVSGWIGLNFLRPALPDGCNLPRPLGGNAGVGERVSWSDAEPFVDDRHVPESTPRVEADSEFVRVNQVVDAAFPQNIGQLDLSLPRFESATLNPLVGLHLLAVEVEMGDALVE